MDYRNKLKSNTTIHSLHTQKIRRAKGNRQETNSKQNLYTSEQRINKSREKKCRHNKV